MRRFRYQGFSREGVKVGGVLDASDLEEARRILRSNGLTVQQLISDGHENRRRFSLELNRPFDTTAFFRELSILTGSSLTLDQALHVMKAAAGGKETQDVIESMAVRLASGQTPSNAVRTIEGLPDDLRALISVGERSGKLAYAFSVIAEDLMRRQTQRKKLMDAAIYPVFLVLMMFGALLVVTFVLVPALLPIFEGSDRSPPLMIQVLSGLREIVTSTWFSILASAALLAFAVFWMFKASIITRLFNSMLLRTPIIGPILIKTTLARYLQSLALLVENSVSLPDALALSTDCCAIPSLKPRMIEMREKVLAGRPLSDAIQESTLFPTTVISLIRAGDQVNRLSVVLANSSDLLQDEATRRSDAMMALMTPMVTIVLGLLVGGLVISVLTALLSVNELGIS
jgi:general secretion pathway protein F